MVTTLPAVLPYLEAQRIPMIGSSNGSEAADHSPRRLRLGWRPLRFAAGVALDQLRSPL
jgi:hypothetical protein